MVDTSPSVPFLITVIQYFLFHYKCKPTGFPWQVMRGWTFPVMSSFIYIWCVEIKSENRSELSSSLKIGHFWQWVNFSSALWLINSLQLLTDRWRWPLYRITTSGNWVFLPAVSLFSLGLEEKIMCDMACPSVHGARWPSFVTWSPN